MSLHRQITTQAQRWLAADASVRIYLLVNPAALHGMPIAIPANTAPDGVSVVDESVVEHPDIKPFLIDMKGPRAGTLLDWWCEQSSTACNLSLLGSSMPMALLGRALMQRMQVILEPDMPLALRLYDTRVLPEAFAVLSATQRQTLCYGISAWAYADRDGELQQLALPPSSLQDDSQHAIHLSQIQADALIDASHADQVRPLLGDAAMAFTAPTISRSHDLLKTALHQAQALGLQSLAQWLAFCRIQAREGVGFHSTSPWAERLADLASGRLSPDEFMALKS